ncbi:MAG: MCE family protein [Planctomycetes bacterium]|nr:MCE family protein [Planctomycetota bacterium]
MTERTRNITVGITAITGLVAVLWLAFIFGELERWTTENYPIRIVLNDATGLAIGSRVKLSGIDVGYVKSLRFTDESAEQVELTCLIDTSRNIPSSASVNAAGSLLGGASQLAITPTKRTPDAPPLTYLPRDGSGELHGTVTTMSSAVAGVARDLRNDLKAQLDNFGKLSKKIETLADEYIAIGQKLNTLLEQHNLADVDAGKVQGNVATMIARADARLGEMKKTIDSINKIVGDEQLVGDLKQTVANTRDLTADAKKQLGELTSRYVAVADELSKTMASMNQIMTDAKAGKGTLGKVLQDPALYDNLTDAAQRLDEMLKEAKLLIEKWKAEGLPIQF